MFQTGGKPSTWFPPVRLVELFVHQKLTFSKFPSWGASQMWISRSRSFSSEFSWKFENFMIFSTFWWARPGVENKGFIDHQSWYSHKIKLQYNINDLNVTNQWLLIWKITKNMKMSTKITDLRGSRVTPIYRGSVCRAGGKPSTWFPPGTRRADHLIHNWLFKFSSWGAPQI